MTWLTSKEVTQLPSFDVEVRERELALFLRQPRRHSRPKGEARHVFYVSHSARDLDRAMERFIKELEAEVQIYTGLSDPIAFYDRQAIGAGQDWSSEIADVVRSTNVALVMMTPALFASAYALREIEALRDAGARILPVEWVTVDSQSVPEWLSVLKLIRTDDPRGLRYLARVDEEGVEYRRTLDAVARAIASLHSQGLAGPAEAPRHEASPDDDTATPVVVTIVAERKDVMQLARPDAANYGLRRRDWIPFSQGGVTAERLVLEAAVACGVEVRIVSLHGFEKWLRRGPRSKASLAILDPWTFHRSQYRDQFQNWRQQRVPWASIVCLEALEARAAFPDAVIVGSQDELRVQLKRLLPELRERASAEGPSSDQLEPPAGPSALK